MRFVRTLLPTMIPLLATFALACAGGGGAAPQVGIGGDADFPAYQPIYPVTIWEAEGSATVTENENRRALLEDIANDQTLFAVTRISGGGGASYGPATITAKGESYKATIDYLKYHSIQRPIEILSWRDTDEDERRWAVATPDRRDPSIPADAKIEYRGPLPVYVGVGLRVQVFFTSAEANLGIGSLGAIGLHAQAAGLSGSLSVQTLGISSEKISTLMPLETELSQPAIQRVIESVAAIKSQIYSQETVATPQIVGFQSPISKGGAVAALTRFVYGTRYTYSIEEASYDAGAAVGGPDKKLWVAWPEFDDVDWDTEVDAESLAAADELETPPVAAGPAGGSD